jgi:putative aldouronate transport system substrate-binding protein
MNLKVQNRLPFWGAAKKSLFVAISFLVCAAGVFPNARRDGASGPVTLETWLIPTASEAGPPPADWKVFQIAREQLGINWNISFLPSNQGDRDSKLQAAAAANTLPDLFWVSRDTLAKLAATGTIAAVDGLYASIPAWYKLYGGDAGRSYTTISGKSYGIAYNGGGQPRNEGMLIRKDWLDKLGLSVPATTQDYLDVMRAFTQRDPDGNGRADTYGFGLFIDATAVEEGFGTRMAPVFGAFGVAGTWNLTKAGAGLNIRKPAYFEALQFIKTMVDEKIIDPNWTSYGRDDFRAAWKQGRFGIMRENHAAYATEPNYAPFDRNFPNGSWIVIDPPRGPRGESSVGAYTQSFGILAVSQKALQSGKGPAIARLLEWMATDDAYYLLGWGERGVNYTLDSNGAPVEAGISDPAMGYSKPAMMPFTQLRGYIQRNSDAELVSRYPTYKAASGKTMSALVTLREMQKRPWTETQGADTLPLPSADLQRFYRQSITEFVTGVRQLTQDGWRAFMTEFDRIGGKDWEDKGVAGAKEGGLLK